MKVLLCLFIAIHFSTVFANTANYELQLEESARVVETQIESEIGNSNTCIDEYLEREGQLRKWLIWTPPAAVLGVPVSTYLGLAAGAGVVYVFNIGGWNGLGYLIGGGLIGFGGSAIGFVGIESWAAISFAKNRAMIHAIVESNEDNQNRKRLKKFFRSYQKKYPNDTIDIIEFAKAISTLDASGRLCDGSLRDQRSEVKLSKKLARKKDLFKAIHLEYGHL